MKRLFLTISAFCLLSNAKAQLNTLNIGSVAPDFIVEDLEGNQHVKKDYEGKYLLVNLYANWSVPCEEQEKLIAEFAAKYNCSDSDIKVLSIDLNGNSEETSSFKKKSTGINNQENSTISGLNGKGDSFHESYTVDGYPTYFIIGPDGLIKETDISNVSSIKSLESALEEVGADLKASQCNSAGIEELENVNTKLYPNPSNGSFTYEFQAVKNEKLTINVVNLVGQVVYTKIIDSVIGKNSFDFNIASLETGSYLLNSINSEGNINSQTLQIK